MHHFGILHPFYISSYCHNSALALYFMMMIRYNKKEKDIQCFLEPWCYIQGFGFPLVYTTVCATMGLFNPNPFMGLCNAFPYPADCTFIDGMECTRGEEAGFIVPIHDATTLVFVVTGMICTWMVFSTIQQRGQAMVRYSFAGQVNENQYRRQHDVALQAVYYTIAYLIGFVTVIITEVLKAVYKPQLETIGDMSNFPFYVAPTFFIWLLFPLGGFLNCIIYILPRYNQWRSFDDKASAFWAFQMVLSGKSPPSGRQSILAHSSLDLTSSHRHQRDSRRSFAFMFNDLSGATSAFRNNMSLRLDSVDTDGPLVEESEDDSESEVLVDGNRGSK